ncbi:unnamed protein product [Adineta ricciae]|uniref:Microbial-type PARG catalytic domain-containing protein n=1 Tax=Adineta ricciae TaxID=249248 RepID=A0A815S532_ADIRI|nr:unnamed protein product [Adineta ricciae]
MTQRNCDDNENNPNDSESKFIVGICKIFGFEEDDNQSILIGKRLLTNGRQCLNEYRSHIARKDFEIQMKNDETSELLKLLEQYYHQQWQKIPFEWFNDFISSHQSNDDIEQYQRILSRLANYGVQFLKTCPVFSIVLQIVFEFDDELTSEVNLFNDIWNLFIIHGYNKALNQSDKYLVPTIKKQYMNAYDSVLFLALRECFRQPLVTLFEDCKINQTRRNLLEITLNSLAKYGWDGGLEDNNVIELISEVQYKKLLSKRNEYLNTEKQLSSSNFNDSSLQNSNQSTDNIDYNLRRFSSQLTLNNSSVSQNTSTNEQIDTYSSPSIKPEDSLIKIYIPNLPIIDSDINLEETISTRLDDLYKIKVSRIECFTDIGVGIIYIHEKDKSYLVDKLQSIVIHPEYKLEINFAEDLEIICYLIFDKPMQLTNKTIVQRWMNVFGSESSPKCEILSIQFSNIIKITMFSIQEVQSALEHRIISINDEIGRIVLQADCCYLEDIPRSNPKITSEQLFCYIITQLKMNDRLRTDRNYCQEKADELYRQYSSLSSEIKTFKSLFYIQYNEETSNAVIITSVTIYQWLLMKFVNIQNESVFKTTNISCKLIVKPIPNDLSSSTILNHKIFQNSIKQNDYKRVHENLVIEITDPHVYDKCLNIRFIEITHNENQLRLQILPYTYNAVINPEDIDINEENWYSTRMFDYKPDITQFDPCHPIFRYKWNSKIWLEQFKQIPSDTNERRKTDIIRRMLRITVMLKTMGAIRAKKYELEDKTKKTGIEIESLKPLITIVYNHQSKLIKSSETNSRLPLFESTNIRVINEDCLISYEKQVVNGYKPLLLNMANASTPGGGYRKGDGAQEENLFRRSNYYLSLDPTLSYQENQLNSCQWFHCSETTKLKPLSIKQQSLYPIDEYGGIYTSGITVLRGTEDTGYPFLSKPLYNVCSLAIAAFRKPPVHDNNRLSLKYAIDTRKKIENFFAIAHQHGHDCLILSAFGCGAFQNPPEHIALIFKSVIIQYAGFFRSIIFSIIDDHNTGNQMNPNGNFLPFQKVLDGLSVRPVINISVGMAIGPYYIIESQNKGKLVRFDNVSILELPLCEYGSNCRNLYDTKHRRSYSHPSLCPIESECPDIDNDVHFQSFTHRRTCDEGGYCQSVDNQQHMIDYIHPNFCVESGLCTNMNTFHLKKFRHVSLCRDGIDCQLNLKMIKEHQLKYRHCQNSCRFSGNCIRFHDQDHIKHESHPFKTPCSQTPFSCELFVEYLQSNNLRQDLENHCLHYSHVCPWGRQCIDTSPKHLSTTIHIAREMCPYGDTNCHLLTNEDHLESFTHTGVRDIRLECRYSAADCRDLKNSLHTIRFRHNYRQDFLGVAQYSGLNDTTDFIFNQDYMIKNLQKYFEKKHKIRWSDISISDDLFNWIRALLPVHRCSKSIFESILVHGHVMSRAHMDKLQEEKFVAHTANQHNNVRKIVSKHVPAVQDNVREFIDALVEMEFHKKNTEINKVSTKGKSQIQYQIDLKEQIIQVALIPKEIDEIRNCVIEVVKASFILQSNKTGIGFERDVELKTNHHVFAILGPHTGHYYGDIVIVFKREIMLHPDSNFTMQAATTYTSPTPDKSPKVYKFRPWLQDLSTDDERLKVYHQTKLHCSVRGYETITALELMAITGGEKRPMKADLKNIIQRWETVDSHQIIETHLPQLIPLSYVDHIYMPKNVFNSLSLVSQQNAQEIFGKKLTVTKHVVNLNVELMAFAAPDPSRQEYYKYVIEQLQRLINEQKETIYTEEPLKYYGITFTMPPSRFHTYVSSPTTISQSKYLLSKSQSNSDDCVYIYWKVIGGDFMLILTNERIQADKVQKNLVYLTCYIASLATSTGTEIGYDERYTYISNSPPTSHDIVLQRKQFKTGSNTFHKGCNPNYYILYSLKINRKTGEVSLTHAGVNGIYNHIALNYTFKKDELDVSILNYVHISSGNQNISVRNLLISHEQIPEAHPKFDKKFVNDINNVKMGDVSKEHSEFSLLHDSSIVNKEEKNNTKTISRTGPLNKLGQFVRNMNPFGSSHISTADKSDPQYIRQLCRYSINCLDQYSKETSLQHNQKYFHICRYAELCKKIDDKSHSEQFLHIKTGAPRCIHDGNCKKITDPVHRYAYRHADYPYLLYPCERGTACRDKKPDHRIKYSHGEHIDIPISDRNSSEKISSYDNHKSHTLQQTRKTSTEDKLSSSPRILTTTNVRSSDHTNKRTTNVNGSYDWIADSADESDDEESMLDFYNADAGKSTINNAAQYDQYGNPKGANYDLGKDGAFKDFSILIAQFYKDSQFNEAAIRVPIDALKIKGFQVKHVQSENECITELQLNRHQIAWIISTSSIQNSAFTSALMKYHSAGGAIFLFADNIPFICHASEFLKAKFGITLDGNYDGSKTLTFMENGHDKAGHYGGHLIFTGIQQLFEGITICHPVYPTAESRKQFINVATATDGQPTIGLYDPSSGSVEGRLALDCGFTKLYCNWDSAGTARYIVNVSTWLLAIEKRIKGKKKKSRM